MNRTCFQENISTRKDVNKSYYCWSILFVTLLDFNFQFNFNKSSIVHLFIAFIFLYKKSDFDNWRKLTNLFHLRFFEAFIKLCDLRDLSGSLVFLCKTTSKTYDRTLFNMILVEVDTNQRGIIKLVIQSNFNFAKDCVHS